MLLHGCAQVWCICMLKERKKHLLLNVGLSGQMIDDAGNIYGHCNYSANGHRSGLWSLKECKWNTRVMSCIVYFIIFLLQPYIGGYSVMS